MRAHPGRTDRFIKTIFLASSALRISIPWIALLREFGPR
jgi:hypothetical protein